MKYVKKWLIVLLLFIAAALPAGADVKLPERMTVIEAEAFRNDISLKGKLTLPEGVTEIGDYAFAGCTELTAVTIPKNVTVIGQGAFFGCKNLRVTVLNGDAAIAEDAFDGCLSVQIDSDAPAADFSYSISSGKVTITKYRGSSAMVVIPETIEGLPVTEIGSNAFYCNDTLRTVSMPISVHTIGNSAFEGCQNLKTVLGTQNVTVYNEKAFFRCPSLSTIYISDRITHVGTECFIGASLPETVIYLPADSPLREENYGFDYQLYGEDISMYFFSVKNGEATFVTAHHGENNGFWAVHIPASYRGYPVTAIGANACYFNFSIATLTLPDSVRTIGAHAFGECYNLRATIYAGGREIHPDAFSYIDGVTILPGYPPAVTPTPAPVFTEVPLVTPIPVPTAVPIPTPEPAPSSSPTAKPTATVSPEPTPDYEPAPDSDFAYTVAEGEVTITAYTGNSAEVGIPEMLENLPVTAIGSGAFRNMTQLKKIYLPASVRSIADDAFNDCSSLEAVYGAEHVTSFGQSAFDDCSSLAYMSFGSGITKIGNYCFWGCKELEATICVSSECEVDFSSWPSPVYESRLIIQEFTVQNGEATVSDVLLGYGFPLTLRIPASFGGVPVTAIGEDAVRNGDLTAVYLPATLRSIGNYAFYDFSSLTAVYGAENVIHFGNSAFGSCYNLVTLDISDDVEFLGSGCFSGCSKLEMTFSIAAGEAFDTSPFSQSGISVFVFSAENGEAALTDVHLSGSTVRSIRIPAFFQGAPVTAIGESVFQFANQVGEVYLPEGIREIGAWAFDNCENLTAVYGAEHVRSFGEGAFSRCAMLEEITLNEYITHLGNLCFTDCVKLKAAIFLTPDCEYDFETYPYPITNSGVTLYVVKLEGSKVRLVEYISGETASQTLHLPSSYRGLPITTVGTRACHLSQYNANLTELVIPSSYTVIESGAFENCVYLENITLPASIVSIGNNAFAYCEKLSGINLPEGLTYLGDGALSYTAITHIDIPDSMDRIHESCFYGSKLESVTFGKNVIYIDDLAFSATKLKEVHVPNHVQWIGESVFSDCTELTNVTLPDQMLFLPTALFKGCTALEAIELPDSITKTSSFAFSGCTKLSRVKLPSSLRYLGGGTFENCTSLTQITLPAGIETILSDAFDGAALQTRAVRNAVNEVIREGMTDFEKALALHDWITAHGSYSHNINMYSPAGILHFGFGVCESYTQAYGLLLDAVGIPNKDVDSAEMNHTWNLVQLGGEWYHVDCTWDDPDWEPEGYHDYFGLSDALISQDHTGWENPDLPPANGTRYQYGVDNSK